MFAAAMNTNTALLLVLVVSILIVAVVCISCSHRRLPEGFPVGPDMNEWLSKHFHVERLAREQEQIETEFPKLTEP